VSDPMKANALLQSVGYKIVCNVNRTIVTPAGTFIYQGWGRSEDVHKVVNPQGQTLKLPINRAGVERKGSGKKIDVMSIVKDNLAKVKISGGVNV